MLKNLIIRFVYVTMALLMIAMPITTGAQAAPASVTFTVNSLLDQPDDLTIPGTCHPARRRDAGESDHRIRCDDPDPGRHLYIDYPVCRRGW